jgi:hypothetical protein
MPLYPVHLAALRHEPLPPIADLTTIEADSPEDALATLRQEPFVMSGGRIGSVWLKLIVSQWANGEARQVLTTEVPVVSIAREN